MSKADKQISCPNCAELVRADAIVCRFCGCGLSAEHFAECPFCREMIRKKAILCRYCKSELPAVKQKGKEEKRGDRLVIPVTPSEGKIGRIGAYLLDSDSIENIGKLARGEVNDPNIRSLDSESVAQLHVILEDLAKDGTVVGSVFFGHDGLPLATTLSKDDAESMATYALGVFMNSIEIMKKLGHQRIHQIVSRTPEGHIIIADFGGGMLMIVTNTTATELLIPLMRKMAKLIAR